MISKIIATDIIHYLQKEKGLSIEGIASSMQTSTYHIKKVLNLTQTLTSANIDSYLKYSNLHFWELAILAIPMHHLSQKTQNKIRICQEISESIKKNQNNACK